MSEPIMCPVCVKVKAPDGLMCHGCTNRLRREILELPELMRELQVAVTRQSQTGTGNGRRGSDVALPFDWNAAHVREDVINTISTWIRDLDHGDFHQCSCDVPREPCEIDPPDTFEGWCGWLARRMPRIRSHPAVVEIDDEIRYCASDVRRAIDTPPPSTFFGTCDVCGRDLYGRSDAAEVVCRSCAMAGIESKYPTTDRRTGLWKDAGEMLVSRRVALAALPVYGLEINPATFRSWLEREMLKPTDDPEQPDRIVYRLSEVLELARRSRDEIEEDRAKA